MPAGTLGRLFALTALMAAPGIMAIGVLAATSGWRAGAVALAIFFVLVCAAILAAPYLRDLAMLAGYVSGLGPAAGTEGGIPPRTFGAAGNAHAVPGGL